MEEQKSETQYVEEGGLPDDATTQAIEKKIVRKLDASRRKESNEASLTRYRS